MNSTFVVMAFVVVGLFAYFFTDEFYAIADKMDAARCTIGMDYYCR